MEIVRDRLIASLRERKHVPVIIIGAGVNGLGTFRDLSLQGVDCVIVDRGDLCAGASRAPSRMIHGGLKYLETGEFRLVSESARERNLLLKNAAHLVHPLELIIPIHSWFGGLATSIKKFLGRPAKFAGRGALIVKAGLSLYDFYGRFQRVLPLHRMIARKNILSDLPDLDPSLKLAASYFDASISSPERLVLELALDGMAANANSIALNHVSFEGQHEGKVNLVDRISGQRFTLATDIVINAAGAWIDDVNAELGAPEKLIGGNKGSHLILDLPALARNLRGRMIYFETDDGRLCLVSSYLGKVLLGTTDIPIANADESFCADEEVGYLFNCFRRVFPGIEVVRDDILFTYCGVRPLPASRADDPGAISRDHTIAVREPEGERQFPVFSLVGGKWTTFRAFSEEVTDMVLARLGRVRLVDTKDVAIGGGEGLAQGAGQALALSARLRTTGAISARRSDALVSRYGSKSLALTAHLAAAGDDPLSSLPDYSRQEIEYLARRELVTSTADFILGRTWLFLDRRMTPAMILELNGILGDLFGWSNETRAADRTAAIEHFRRFHRIDIARGGHYEGCLS